MNQQKIIIKTAEEHLSFDLKKFEKEARKILKTVVLPQVEKADKTQLVDRKRCVSRR